MQSLLTVSKTGAKVKPIKLVKPMLSKPTVPGVHKISAQTLEISAAVDAAVALAHANHIERKELARGRLFHMGVYTTVTFGTGVLLGYGGPETIIISAPLFISVLMGSNALWKSVSDSTDKATMNARESALKTSESALTARESALTARESALTATE